MGPIARLFPAGLWMRLMGFALVFTVGLALGNHWATQRALERELQASADRQRENHQQLIAWYAGKMKELRLAREQQEGADAAAYAILQKGKADAERAAARARASLRAALAESQKLKETTDGLKAVNEMLAAELRPNDPGCVLSSGVRRTLDLASGAVDPADSGDHPEASPPSVPDGSRSTSSDAALTCDELARGYVALSEHGRMLSAWVQSWQAWASEALR